VGRVPRFSRSSQNLDPEGLIRKIFQNKELAAGFGSLAECDFRKVFILL
jgi:hypothetical protein